ncbi:MAG: response regulator [Rhodospirillaceae bacterium]|jgi:DNA-binding NarL/FixJ family response regulator|nr:response regulator [Rhodospirillales bacterium]MBT3906469.1 response regulator [Rhodospirillaceae bacterium]MBT4703456.1 response regulator [Rhodospirillaceae bacterium]MBT5034280.1 response regulator [Rhodospirillaceae bacterium]MBT6218147.1 response regulator [Rhodospirillaceae bacterium]
MSDELSRGDETRNPAQILVIDDEPFILEYIGAILSSHNIVPILEYTFEKALLQIRSKPVDLVITDLFMPGMGGIEGIKVLKDEFPNIKILAMSAGFSGLPPEDAVEAARKIGADAALIKPLQQDYLEVALADLGYI